MSGILIGKEKIILSVCNVVVQHAVYEHYAAKCYADQCYQEWKAVKYKRYNNVQQAHNAEEYYDHSPIMLYGIE